MITLPELPTKTSHCSFLPFYTHLFASSNVLQTSQTPTFQGAIGRLAGRKLSHLSWRISTLEDRLTVPESMGFSTRPILMSRGFFFRSGVEWKDPLKNFEKKVGGVSLKCEGNWFLHGFQGTFEVMFQFLLKVLTRSNELVAKSFLLYVWCCVSNLAKLPPFDVQQENVYTLCLGMLRNDVIIFNLQPRQRLVKKPTPDGWQIQGWHFESEPFWHVVFHGPCIHDTILWTKRILGTFEFVAGMNLRGKVGGVLTGRFVGVGKVGMKQQNGEMCVCVCM